MTSATLSARLCFLTATTIGMAGFAWNIFDESGLAILFLFPGTLAALAGSVPALIILLICIPFIQKWATTVAYKFSLLLLIQLLTTIGYGILAGIINLFDFVYDDGADFFKTAVFYTAALFACTGIAVLLSHKKLTAYFSENIPHNIQTNTIMDSYHATAQEVQPLPASNHSNKILIKTIITGVLILALMIPTFFIDELVKERQQRNEEIVAEVSSNWAGNQVLSAPYLYIPYKNNKSHITVLPEQVAITGDITPEDRQRSIYKVLLYKSTITGTGNFSFTLPKEIITDSLAFENAKICLGISDFKGIEDKITLQFNKTDYELSPGLPANDIDSNGLSAPVALTAADLQQHAPFAYTMRIKGSGRLHFIPAAGSSSYLLRSSWPNPSFDGTAIPNEHVVSDGGFSAKWTFNKASLPFPMVLQQNQALKNNLDFGVSILQPVDDYAKTSRCIKYAILFIGLTFAMFFIVEILQKKPVHPVQYVLVGLALVIFYSLLLSMSEFIHFDLSYGIASVATVSLISLYAKSHFKKWKTAGLFALVLGGLYAFNYVLISLEDTALLVGSIGLFIILSFAMYASRKINWYGSTMVTAEAA